MTDLMTVKVFGKQQLLIQQLLEESKNLIYSSLSFEAFCRDIMWPNKAYTNTTPARTIISTKFGQSYGQHGGDGWLHVVGGGRRRGAIVHFITRDINEIFIFLSNASTFRNP
jgi:hypothetical protein